MIRPCEPSAACAASDGPTVLQGPGHSLPFLLPCQSGPVLSATGFPHLPPACLAEAASGTAWNL